MGLASWTDPSNQWNTCLLPIRTHAAHTRAPHALTILPMGNGWMVLCLPHCGSLLPAVADHKTNCAARASPGICVPDLQHLPPVPGSTPFSFQAPFSCPRAQPFRTPLLSRAQALGLWSICRSPASQLLNLSHGSLLTRCIRMLYFCLAQALTRIYKQSTFTAAPEFRSSISDALAQHGI